MRNLLAILPLFFISITAEAKVNCDRHPIYCQMVKLKPSINRTFAMELSNYIYKYSRRYNTDPMVSVAIAMQESSLTNIDRMGSLIDTKSGKVVKGVTDVGVFQLHVDTIQNYKEQLGWDIDFQRLRTDVEYQTFWHVRTLKRKIRICSIDKYRERYSVEHGNEWSCYHSFTTWERKRGKLILDKNGKKAPGPRLTYLRLVSRFLPKIPEIEEESSKSTTLSASTR